MIDSIATPEVQTIAMMQAKAGSINEAAQKLKQQGGHIKNMAEIEAAAKEFEAVFMTEMIKPMFEGIKPNETFGGGHGEEIFQSLMVEEYGKLISEAGGVGIAENVKAELIRIQETQEAMQNGTQ